MANEFTVKIQGVKPRKKTSVIKSVREVTGLSLRKSKEIVDSLGVVAKGISKMKAEEIKAKLEAAGAIVEISSTEKPKPKPKPEVKVPLKNLEIKELNTKIKGKIISDQLVEQLKKKKIKTLSDIWRNDGIPLLKDLSPKDEKALQKLESHAYLSLVSDDPKVNQSLIDTGFYNITDISESTRKDFVAKAKKTGIKEDTAFLLHSKSVNADAFIKKILTDTRAEMANNFDIEPAFDVQEFFPRQCECKDCESAVSPIAYLTDLLDYTTKHVEGSNGTINIADLEEQFHQPFGRLTASCEEVNRKVRQVRICIEVLRSYLKEHPLPIDYDRKYLFEAYKTLLNQIGTSYDEIRLVRTADPEKRRSLAERLGIGLRSDRSDELDELFLAPETLNEQMLEQLFGLVDTTRDPLCDGIKSEDSDEKIRRWNFNGVEWNRNTDENGNIYGDIRITNIPSDEGIVYMVNLYKDSKRTQRVASGEGTLGTFVLSEKKDSGLSARIQIDEEPQNNRFEISVIPSFLAWRLKHLRTLWREQEWPTDPYIKEPIGNITEENLLPIIDPDVIGPDDFRIYNANISEAFALWAKRREWIDDRLMEFTKIRSETEIEEEENPDAKKLNAMLAHLNDEIVYETENGTKKPWADTVTVSDLTSIKAQLDQGQNLEELNAWIAEKYLTVDGFIRLAEVANQAEKKEDINEEDWLEVDSILVQVIKRVFFRIWREEEAQTKVEEADLSRIELDPRIFWIALIVPEEGIWSPALHKQRPLIDPEIIELEGLLPPPIGQKARNIWDTRRAELEEIRQGIIKAYANGKLEGAMSQALGDPPTIDPSVEPTWVDFIQKVDDDRKSTDEDIRKAAEDTIRNQLYMSLEDFPHLVTIKMKEDHQQEPSEEEVDTLYAILTSAQKRKTLYPTWKDKEETENLSYWRVLKTKLPSWRATQEARFQWQYALKTRSQAPIIDPDLITDDDLKNPIPDDPAHDILHSRKDWVKTQKDKIKEIRENGGLSWGEQGSGEGKFMSPQDIAVLESGYFYVADSRNHLIQKLDWKGRFIKQWGGYPGSGEGEFKFPGSVAVDKIGNVYVADTGNNRIQKFDLEGVFLREWGKSGSGEGEFRIPSAVAVDGNRKVYVADTRNHRIQKFDSEGEFVIQWGEPGSEDGQFLDPLGVTVDGSGNVYVADTGNNRIQKFDSDGAFLKQWGESGSSEGEFQKPVAVGVDVEGKIYITDNQNHRIQKFDSEGVFLREWGESRGGLIQMVDPRGLTVDGSGMLYVSDAGSHQIHMFDSTDGFETILRATLDVFLKDLLDLAEEQKQGNDIIARLDQLSLPMDAFSYLMRTHDLISGDTGVMDSEWDDVYNILVHAKKRRIFAEWRYEEKQEDLILSPDFFKLAKDEPQLLQWRATREDRWDWKDRLSARIDQEKTTINGMAEIVDSCEESTLTLLRDALIMASDTSGNDLETKAKSLTDNLLIDCQTSACQKTTRVSQALTTLQNLIFSLKTGQLEGSELALIYDENFDEEWKWIGSYETWKAAVGVFLYPENILLPGLRKISTRKFMDIVTKARTLGRRFESVIATQLAEEYELYLENTCENLQIIEVVQCHLGSTFDPDPNRVYVIARGGNTKKLYMCHYDYDSKELSIYGHSGWNEICELEKSEETKVIGAVNYAWENRNYIYLFFWYENALNFIKHDIISQSWDSQVQTLDLPDTSESMHALVMKGKGSRQHLGPTLAILINRKLYLGRVEEEQWEDEPTIIRNDFVVKCEDMIWISNGPYHYDSFVLIRRIYARPYEGLWFWLFTQPQIGNTQYTVEEYEMKTDYPVKGWLPRYGKAYDIPVLSNFYVLSGTDSETYWKDVNIKSALITWDEEEKVLNTNVTWVKAAIPSCEWSRRYDRHAAVCSVPRAHDEENNSFLNNVQQYHSLYSSDEQHNMVIDPYQSNLIAISVAEVVDLGLASKYRRQFTQQVFEYYGYEGHNAPPFLVECVKEGFYFLPVLIALHLQRAGQYTAALDWFRTVYDYARPIDERKIYYGLELEEEYENGYSRLDYWLLDPLNVHEIASTRRNTYTRFTLISIIRCLLAYADAEFTSDTAESLTKARTLYETALELLDSSELNQHLDWCKDIIGYLEIEIEDPRWQGVWKRILNDMARISNATILESTVNKVRHIMGGSGKLSNRIAKARQVIHEALNKQIPSTIGKVLDVRRRTLTEIPRVLLKKESVEKGVEKAVLLAETVQKFAAVSDETDLAIYTPVTDYIPNVAILSFCIPPNPMIKALRFHVEINLHKLRTCRNIAGVKREVEAYAAPTDILSAMPAIGPGGQLIVPTRITPPPVPYRYEFLVERAKQLANMAAQMEAAVLSALERKDIESYNLLKARQDVRLARTGVKLQNLRLRQARDEVALAELQQESAQIQAQTYQEWLAAPLNQWENRMIDAYHRGAVAQTMAAYFDAGAQMYQAAASATALGAPAAFMVSLMAMGRYMASSVAIQAETSAQVAAVWAGYERRRQEWLLQSELALHSIRIGEQQIKIANDGVNIVHQEVNIARMQVEQAEDTVEFLRSKFTNVELYNWMNRILEEVYSYFLQQATSMAKLAQNQLAFERQETPLAFIQDDYWEVPSENSIGGATEDSVDRHGLTGSARLMADIYKLDQYRLETEKRKLQLIKSISLARVAPFEFQRFKETGVIVFDTSMKHFDRDFPGHYMRMIKRVRTSVIALIPPTQGIKATLSNIGVSRIVVNRNNLFQMITAHRPPESVALTSPSNATGLFELESQSEMLLPFEGLGVDTVWEFRMPKAVNRFDYSTIADVIITVEYTALDSFDYRQQVIDTLPSKVSSNRPFSFRHQFADQWYDLHNPEQTDIPMTVCFRTRREDFPPNIEDLKIEHVLMYFARADGISDEIETTLHFRPNGEMVDMGGEATSVDGVISTRRGNAGSWVIMQGQSPIGKWELALPNTEEMKDFFKSGEIEDILFVITYSGRTPEWPE